MDDFEYKGFKIKPDPNKIKYDDFDQMDRPGPNEIKHEDRDAVKKFFEVLGNDKSFEILLVISNLIVATVWNQNNNFLKSRLEEVIDDLLVKNKPGNGERYYYVVNCCGNCEETDEKFNFIG